MKSWENLEPDVYRLMNKHYTPGRAGHKIDMVVIHHNAGILSIDQIWQVWQSRAASAHYQVESGGRIGQLVNDWDTAWHAANSNINSRSIGIEVSNSGGAAQDWPITDTAIVEAGRLTAAVCFVYKLGRPVAGQNVRFHREFTSTSCPYHLAPGGKYHQRLMQAATDHYDWMAGGGKTPESSPQEGITVDQADRIIKHLTDFIAGFVGPVGSDVKDVREQMCGAGSRDSGTFSGWPQLGTNADGADLTLVDAVAALRRDVDALRKEIKR